MMNFFDGLRDRPGRAAILLFSLGAAVWGIASGMQTGKFNPDPKQAAIEARLTADVQRNTDVVSATEKANARYDRNCEGIFTLDSNAQTYSPLTNHVPIGTGDYAARVINLRAAKKPIPSQQLTDFIPAGMEVCDAYGNTGYMEVVAGKGNGAAVVTDIAKTGDLTRIESMLKRNPGYKPALIKSTK
jgi:hypothetical protein